MDYYNKIKQDLITNEINKKVKQYSINKSDLTVYYNVGKMLSEAGKHYGKEIIKEYSNKLMNEIGKKYNKRTLFRMKQFYSKFSNSKVSTMWTLLSWSHIRLLFGLDVNGINYYIKIITDNHITVRELEFKIKSKEYERLPKEVKTKLGKKKKTKIADIIPNPIIIKRKDNYETIFEKALQKMILEDIPSFLKELGSGFSFIDSEYKIKIGNTYNYIDLLLFNIEFNCYVVVELKVTKFKKEHIGQVLIYMKYIDENLKKPTQDKTIKIIVCKEDNKYIIKYCSDERIISRKYQLI